MTTGRLPSVEGGIQPTIVDAKGDIIAATAADTVSKLSVGANDTVLTADSSTATGLKWAAAAAGGGLVLLTSGSFSGASTTLSSISGSYKDLKIVIRNFLPATGTSLRIRVNGDTAGNYRDFDYTQSGFQFTYSETSFVTQSDDSATSGTSNYIIDFYDYANTVTRKLNLMQSTTKSSTNFTLGGRTGSYNNTAAITSITFLSNAASFTGDYFLYGVQ